MNRIFKNRNVFFLILILTSSTLIITGISLSLIYNRAIRNLELTMTDIVMREKAFIKVFFNNNYSEEQILAILKNVKELKPGIGKTGDFMISRMKGDSIEYLIAEKHIRGQYALPETIRIYSPLLRSLNGESGFYKGPDSWNVNVYSAYTYLPELKWAITAKIPVKEVNRSYIQAGVFALILALALISFCIYLFVRITDPFIKKLTESESKLNLLFNNSADAILIHDLNGDILEANDTASMQLQYSKDELRKLNLRNIDSLAFIDKIPERFIELIREGKAFFETGHVTKNNEIIPTEINAKIIDYIGRPAVLCIARDIRKRKEVENSLRESEEKFRTLINVSIDAILLNVNNHFTYANTAALELFGAREQADIINRTPFELFHPDYHESIRERLSGMKNRGTSVILAEEKIIRMDGRVVDVEVAATPFFLKGERSILIVLRDITERKEAEEEIQRSQFILKQQNEEFLTLNEELNESNNQIQKINEDLLISMKKAEESDRLKTAFLQNISHEIRTPLNAIMGFSELMRENYNDPEKLDKFSGIIINRSNDLLEIINEILDIAKIESGQLPVSKEDCNIDMLFGEIHTFFSEQTKYPEKKHIKLTFKPANLTIKADCLKLRQILINLVGNAYKFTENGFIEVGCLSFINNGITFYVKDSGIGIPEDKQQIIFDRFTQVNNDSSRLYGGTGLGLPIVRGLLELMQGRIWVESQLKKGSVFYFSFPAELVLRNSIKPGIKINMFYPEGNHRNILVVEDDDYNAELLVEILKRQGFNIIRCVYGREALRIVAERKIDLILMDIRLPDIEGYEVTRQIKILKPEIKIIAQTAYAAASDEEKAFKAGCDDYISKPVKKDHLLSKIHYLLHGNMCLNEHK